jgi:hypothetical protein
MAKITMELTKEDVELYDLPWSCEEEWMNGAGHRWSYGMAGVFELDGEHWMIEWQHPASEIQQDSEIYPWEWWSESDRVTATKVVHLPVVKKEWVPVDVCIGVYND